MRPHPHACHVTSRTEPRVYTRGFSRGSSVRASRRRAFTLVELLVGMVVTGFVMAAVAAFVFGVSEHWQRAGAGQQADLAAGRAVDRLDRLVRPALLLDAGYTPGSLDGSGPPAACMYWRADANADGSIQRSETGLLAYDPATRTVVSYAVPDPAGLAADPTASPPGFDPPAAFAGTAGVVATPVAKNVAGCAFHVTAGDAKTRPSLEVTLAIDDGKTTPFTAYTTVALRCPNGEPK